MSDDTPESDGPGIMEKSIADALEGQPLEPEDVAMATLARAYARAVDRAGHSAEVLTDIGPKLFACLESLGLSPRARAAARKGGTRGTTGPRPGTGLDDLRERRARKRDAAPLDPAAP
jgi:hypothetical protein